MVKAMNLQGKFPKSRYWYIFLYISIESWKQKCYSLKIGLWVKKSGFMISDTTLSLRSMKDSRNQCLGTLLGINGQNASASKSNRYWSEVILNYWVMVEGYPNFKEEVGGSNPGCEISSLLDGKLARWSTASCAWRWPVSLLSQKKFKKNPTFTCCNLLGFSFISLGCIPQIPLKWSVIFFEVLHSNQLFVKLNRFICN